MSWWLRDRMDKMRAEDPVVQKQRQKCPFHNFWAPWQAFSSRSLSSWASCGSLRFHCYSLIFLGVLLTYLQILIERICPVVGHVSRSVEPHERWPKTSHQLRVFLQEHIPWVPYSGPVYRIIMVIIKHINLALSQQRLCIQLEGALVVCAHSVGLGAQSTPLCSQEQSQSDIASSCGDYNLEHDNFLNC